MKTQTITITIDTLRAVIHKGAAIEGAIEGVIAQLMNRLETGRFVSKGSGEPAITDPDFRSFVSVSEKRNGRWVRLTGICE